MFASDLDPASKQQLARGERLVELLKQRQADPYPVEDQVVSVWAGTTGRLDDVAVGDIARFESEWIDHLHRNEQGLLDALRERGDWEDSTQQALATAFDAFRPTFVGSAPEDEVAAPEESGDDALDSQQEQITTQKR